MAKKPLTAKQEAWCREYLKDCNGAQAAIRAGYSPRSAKVAASQNMSKANLSVRLQELITERDERVSVDADWVLSRLAAEATLAGADPGNSQNRIKALELLAKHHGMLIERRETGKPGDFEHVPDEELDNRIVNLAEHKQRRAA